MVNVPGVTVHKLNINFANYYYRSETASPKVLTDAVIARLHGGPQNRVNPFRKLLRGEVGWGVRGRRPGGALVFIPGP